MTAAWLVILYPAAQMAFYVPLFTVARMLAGYRGISRMSQLAPHLVAVPLAAIAAAVYLLRPDAFAGWQRGAAPWWFPLAAAAGVALFYGESALNGWMARRDPARRGAMDGFVFVPLLAPLQSVVVVFLEESLWRGVLIGALAAWIVLPSIPAVPALGLPAIPILAVLASAAFFSLHHLYFGPVTAVYKGFSATVWGVLFCLSGSLWVCFVAHLCSDLLTWVRLASLSRDHDDPELQLGRVAADVR